SDPPASATPDMAAIERLIRQLGSAEFKLREAAGAELEKIGEAALPALRQAQRGGDAEVKRRAAVLVGKITAQVQVAAEVKVAATVKRLGGKLEVVKYQNTPGECLWIHLRDTKVSDKDLACFKECKKIDEVWLEGTQVTDAGIAHLAGLIHLGRLD